MQVDLVTRCQDHMVGCPGICGFYFLKHPWILLASISWLPNFAGPTVPRTSGPNGLSRNTARPFPVQPRHRFLNTKSKGRDIAEGPSPRIHQP